MLPSIRRWRHARPRKPEPLLPTRRVEPGEEAPLKAEEADSEEEEAEKAAHLERRSLLKSREKKEKFRGESLNL